MPLKRPAYRVLLVPEDADPTTVTDEDCTEVRVVVHAADQLKAELEAGKLGLKAGGKDAPLHVTMLWLWASMVRTDDFRGAFREFRARCLAYDPDRDRPAPHDDPDSGHDDLDAHPTAASTD